MIELETEVNITETDVQPQFKVEPGTYWTGGGSVYMLVECENSGDGETLYVAANLATGRQWMEETVHIYDAVDGLDPLNATVEITQTERRVQNE